MASDLMTPRLRWIVSFGLALLAGCAPVGPDFVKPDVAPGSEWSQPLDEGLQAEAHALKAWWHVFDDPVMDALIQTALGNNNNLKIAGLRTLEARAQLAVATGAQYPQTQIVSGDGVCAQSVLRMLH